MTDAFGRASNHEDRHKEWQDEIDRRDEIINSDRQVIADLQADLASTREILAHNDMGSLPNRWTLTQIAEARISDMLLLRDQVSDTCAKAEKAEKYLASALEALEPFAKEAKSYEPNEGDDDYVAWDSEFLIRDLRRAATVKGGKETSDS